MALQQNILQTIGGTPIVRLGNLSPDGVTLYAKIESFNPGGSVKDRIALSIIEDAERSGTLQPGQTVVEATSGNTGIALAMVCAQKGYPCVIVMAENFSVERRKLMRFLGANVVLTPAAEKGTGMLNKAIELSEKHGWFLTRQFENPANAEAHAKTTAVEILEDFDGLPLNAIVLGAGTGGTLNGISRVFRKARPDTRIVVCEPDNSPVLASGIPQPRAKDGGTAPSHPNFRPHAMQGWSPDFISPLTAAAIGAAGADRVQPVSGDDALHWSRQLAQKEGILAGITAGATLAGAMALAETAPKGANIVCLLPDTGERYMSTPLFDAVPEEMTGDEIEISKSTPRYRFDVAPAPQPAASKPVDVDAQARDYVARVISDPDKPVVMFSLEWCEFCWSVRKLFTELGVDYETIPLDSVAYQKDNLGGKVRAVLHDQLGSPTIPQIFVGSEYVGGATETFDAYNDGRLGQMMAALERPLPSKPELDAYSFLPKWLHAR